jgi:hypothetical protein
MIRFVVLVLCFNLANATSAEAVGMLADGLSH